MTGRKEVVMEELVKVNVEISNKELKVYTTKIKNCGENIRKNYIKIAHLLNEVDSTECYIDDGFVDTQDYASKVLGIQKTTCYNLLKIAKEYINEDGTRTILTSEGQDFGVSQVQALLPLGVDEAKALCEAGEITPNMSVRQIKKIVADNKTVESEDEDNDEVDGEVISEDEEIVPNIGSIDFLEDGTLVTHGELPEKFIVQIEDFFHRCYISDIKEWAD